MADPHNAYDAALGTATYLCLAMTAGAGPDLDAKLRSGFFSYSHSNAYVETVLSLARAYDGLASQLPALLLLSS